MAVSDITKPIALDETLQDTNDLLTAQNGKLDTLNTNVGGVAKDTTLQSTNTALGLLGKDATLQSIVTALATIGLNTVGNLASLTTEQKTSLVAAINELNTAKVDTSDVGVANGVAELDNTGKVPSTQLPSFVDDVLEYSSVSAFPATGESGKIYVALDTNKTYRWGGSGYVVISETLALGETSSTAYRGDRGKTAYDHSQDASRVTSATSVGLYKVGATAEGHVSGLTAVVKADITALGIPGQDTTYNDATQSTHGLMSTSDKTKLDGISSNAKKVEASTTNGNIKIDGVETQVYDDSDVTSAISDLGDDVEAIEDELSTGTDTVEGNPINFTTKSAQNAKSTILSVEPIQDLHGYSKPWVGGAGKNLLPMVLDDIKSANTSGTWSGNVYTRNGVSFNVITDNDNNILGIKVTGTASAETVFVITNSIGGLHFENNTTYKINAFTSDGGSTTTYSFQVRQNNTWKEVRSTSDETMTYIQNTSTNDLVRCIIRANYACPTNGIMFYPMIRLSTETDATFEPYTNICPISGRTEIGILGEGKNLVNVSDATNITSQSVLLDNFVLDAGTYSVSGLLSNSGTKGVRLRVFNSPTTTDSLVDTDLVWNTEGLVSGSFVLNEKTTIGILLVGTGAGYNASVRNVQLERNSSATTFEPYQQSNSLTISLGQTVYGGTLDVENGVLVVDKVNVDLGDLTWEKSPSQYPGGFVSASLDTYKRNKNVYGLCSCYKFSGIALGMIDVGNGEIRLYYSDGAPNRYRVYIKDLTADDLTAEQFTSFIAGQKLVYELGTPITINLTPHTIKLLEGVNNINVDDANATITLTYRDGSVATLGDLTSAVDNLDSKIDESKILTDTVTGDKYRLVVTNGVLDIQQISN